MEAKYIQCTLWNMQRVRSLLCSLWFSTGRCSPIIIRVVMQSYLYNRNVLLRQHLSIETLAMTGPGHCLNIKTVFPSMVIPIIKVRRSSDRLIFMMGVTILLVRRLYIEMAPIGFFSQLRNRKIMIPYFSFPFVLHLRYCFIFVKYPYILFLYSLFSRMMWK